MGAKDSKPSFISYDEAVKRVSDSELRRIREAFKRSAGANGTSLSLEAFAHDVLCDGVPFEVAEWLYQACGGTKRGIAFKELLCGIVVLTKGNIEEKIKFLWTLYVNNQSDSGTYIYKWDLARALHIENSSLPFNGTQWSAEILTGLFGSNERVTFDQFRSWLLIHKDATVLSKWLLSDCTNSVQNLETPTFYQSLAGVTHLEERDIIELEKCFWSLHNAAPTGQLDAESLAPLLSPPLPRAAVKGVFLALDENRDGHVDFKELCCGLSAACRGPTTERLKFCFKIFDLDRDGVLNKRELIDMIDILCFVAEESMNDQKSRASTPSDGDDSDRSEKGFDPETILLNLRDKCLANLQKDGRKPVFQLGPTNGGEPINIFMENTEEGGRETLSLTLEDFLIWSVESAEALVTPFLELIFEVCHIVLGLRPQCKHQEKDIVLGWLRREVHRGYAVGQFWYLVSAEWWAAWSAYGSRGANDACCRQAVRPADEAIVCDESFTTTSSESMGSLLWRCDSASLGSAGSSSGVSSAPALRPHASHAPHPGAVDNKRLLAPGAPTVPTLTGEGGHLRRDVTLVQHRDFELLPDALWRALAHWYGGPDPLPRQVVRPPNSEVELELYPLQLQILRHVAAPHRVGVSSAGMGVGAGGAALYSSVPLAPAPPDTQLAYTAAFSRLATVRQVSEFLCQALRLAREDVRLWALGAAAGCSTLLDDDRPTLRDLRLDERARILLEVRNPDLTWPEEIGALSVRGGSRATERRETLIAPDLPGATGLHNLGNTCYMNAALQAVWNTGPLTKYFNSDMHLYEVNASNPLGTRGALALRFGELCQQVWACNARSVAPLRVRLCVSRWARHLAGGGQHDAQELLAWLLDALHEDLNRASTAADATPAQPAANDSSGGRSDREAAAEAWAAHAARNRSVVTELFHGQLKSRVRCDVCAKDSVRFDAFNMLSLPLPLESFTTVHVKVTLLDGSVPVKYGVRVNSEGTLLDVKRHVAELCGLSCAALALVELSGGRVTREWDDATRVAAVRTTELHAYEVPPRVPGEDTVPAAPQAAAGAEAGAGADEVSPAQEPSSLCMPALFCFKRSRSEIVMGQSPSEGVYTFGLGGRREWRAGTLPRSRPAPAAELLRCGSSPADMQRLGRTSDASSSANGPVHYLFAVHRKQSRADAYFLPWQRVRAALFGAPLVVRVQEGGTGRQLYDCVWAQLERLLSARPPPPERKHHNHAADCDDSLGYEFPFTLRVVRADAAAAWCALCPWPALCRGCALPSDDAPLLLGCGGSSPPRRASFASPAPLSASPAARAKLARAAPGELRQLDLRALRGAVMLAIDWDPTALHLRYQPTREKECITHASVLEAAAAAARAVDLAHCLRAFTSPERLEARYECARCRTKQPATKTLQIWRAPPILIIHLKRFQYVNNKWAKSQKVVNFPFEDFDPTAFLAAVPQETILRHRDLVEAPSDDEPTAPAASGRKRLESASLSSSPVTDDELVDYHQHRLVDEQDPLDLKYRLYAAVCHSGQLSGGHYVAYARNPSGAWLCYNDSSCREVAPADGPPPNIDPASAYLLFYERRGLHYDSYLPALQTAAPKAALADDDEDVRSACALA